MKVGIVTYQYAYNYGAVLQCLALQRTLNELGGDASAINYFPPDMKQCPIWKGWGIKSGTLLSSMRKKILRIRCVKSAKTMRRAFDRFRSAHVRLSEPCATNAEVALVVNGYDALVAGSDQIWHFSRAPMYFLEWGHSYDGKRISYAPCCGSALRDQDPAKIPDVKKWLSRFDHISVRNDFSQEIVKTLTGDTVPVVADPTLLTDLSDVQQKVELPCTEYILMYTLGKEIAGSHKETIRAIRSKVGNIPVVAVIPSAHQPHLAPWADIKISDADPGEWLYLIANARFIYTDSYHGALFSMKNKKPFLAYYTERERAPRLLDLASRYAVENSVVGSLNEALEKKFMESMNYEEIQLLMSEHAEKSRTYLEASLNG